MNEKNYSDMRSKATALVSQLLEKDRLENQISELLSPEPVKESLKGSGRKKKNREYTKRNPMEVKRRTTKLPPREHKRKKKQLESDIAESPVAKVEEELGTEIFKELEDKFSKSTEKLDKLREHLDNPNILWSPHPGPQTQFLSSPEYEVGFFGGRGPLAYGENIITPTGPVPVENIKIGDEVCVPGGTTARVVDIPFDGVGPCARITFSDGRQVTSTIDHRWIGRLRRGRKGYTRKFRPVLTEQFKQGGQIPLTCPVYFSREKNLIDPYVLGLMLGDGHMNSHISITSNDKDIISAVKNEYSQGKEYRDGCEYRLTFNSKKKLSTELEFYNLLGCLSNSKFIPSQYKYNSVDTRLAVLQGLMDTDGYAAGSGVAEFTSVSEQLVKDVQELVWSLGGRATLGSKVGRYKNSQGDYIECQKVYRLYITLQEVVPFKLPRKVEVYTAEKKYRRHNTLTVVDYEEVGELPCRCITVDHPTHEILTTNYIVTKNSGKSDCLLVDPLRFVHHPKFRGLLIRKTMPALRELISRAKYLYPKMYPGTKWKEQEKIFEFPSGAIMELGYFDHMDDYDRYHGRQFCWLGIDEITQYNSREYYDKIKSVARSVDPELPVRVRTTCNPSGPGRMWVKEYFEVGDVDSNKAVEFKTKTPIGDISVRRKYIRSTIFDNPTLLQSDPGYVARLASLPEVQRRQWLEGDFDAAEGLAFEDFRPGIHIVEPFNIPSNWVKIRAIDWGYRSKAVCLWIAIDHDDNAWVYREYVTSLVNADVFAMNVLSMEEGEYISYGVIDGSVGDQRGINGPTIDEEMRRVGLVSLYADKSKGSRIHGKMLVHKYLALDSITKQPRLKIFSTCKQLIKEFSSLMVDVNNSEDVDTKMEDHAYDALRYGLGSRPPPPSDYGEFGRGGHSGLSEGPIIVDRKFGY